MLAGQARLGMAGQLRGDGPLSRGAQHGTEVGDLETECGALNTLGILQCYLEDDTAGLDADRVGTGAGAIGDAYQQWRSLWNRYVCAAESGHLEEAVARTRTARREVPRIGYGHQLPELYWHLQTELTDLGRFDEAVLPHEGAPSIRGRRRGGDLRRLAAHSRVR